MNEKISIRFFATVIIIWALDFITKIWALDALQNVSVISIIGDFLQFRLVYNTGGVFGIMQGNPYIFQTLTGVAIIFLFIYYVKADESGKAFTFAIAFVLGGALGNFTDRFFRPGVVDFVDMGVGIHRWPTYNVADAFISVGAVLLGIAFFISEKIRKDEENEISPNGPEQIIAQNAEDGSK